MGFLNWVRVQWDRAAALAASVIGVLALLLGWIGVSGQSYVAKQLPYIVSGALFGIFMVGIAAVLWLSADLRDEWRELRGIRLALREQVAAASGSPADASARPSPRRPASPATTDTTEFSPIPADDAATFGDFD